MQLLIDPRQQAHRTISHRIPNRLRLRLLLEIVAEALLSEPFSALDAGELFLAQRRLHGTIVELGMFCWRRRGWDHHVEVGAFAGFGVEETHASCDGGADVATLCYYIVR